MSGTVVLIHGAWSGPADWRWVLDALPVDVRTEAVDLVSHRRSDAHRSDDVAQIADVITAAGPPVVVVGWSYGGSILSDLPAGDLGVRRLIYVSAVPSAPPDDHTGPPPGPDPDTTHLVFADDGTVTLDNDWFLTSDPAVATMAPVVVEHLRAHPRRPMSLNAVLEPPSGAAWREISTTVVVGAADELITDAQRSWATAHIADTRVTDCDHFIPFRQPELIATAASEALRLREPPTGTI